MAVEQQPTKLEQLVTLHQLSIYSVFLPILPPSPRFGSFFLLPVRRDATSWKWLPLLCCLRRLKVRYENVQQRVTFEGAQAPSIQE